MTDYSRDLLLAKWGSGVSLRGSNLEPPMSALGQKRTLRNIDEGDRHVCFVPIANIKQVERVSEINFRGNS